MFPKEKRVTHLLLLRDVGSLGGAGLLLALPLLQEGLGDQDVVVGRDGTGSRFPQIST